MSDPTGCTLGAVLDCPTDQLKSLLEATISVPTFAIAVLALAISVYTFVATRRHLSAERVHRLTERLIEMDRAVIADPILQQILYQRALTTEPFFTETTPHDLTYFRLKSFVYMHINFYDEIISLIAHDRSLKKAVEVDAWKAFIIFKMRHPLFREIYQTEELWGRTFKAFIAAADIDKPYSPDEREWF